MEATEVQELAVGPAMDAAVAELMGAEPLYNTLYADGSKCCGPVQRKDAEFWASIGLPGRAVVPAVHPAYSTTDEHAGKVLDWLVAQHCTYHFWQSAADLCLCEIYVGDEFPVVGRGVTRAEAICRAALATRGIE